MATVVENIIADTLKWTKDGLQATRVFKVFDLTGEPSSLIGAALLADGIPKRGQAHPGIGALFVDEVEARPIAESYDAFEVTARYVTPNNSGNGTTPEEQKTKVSIGASLQSVTTNKDFNGVAPKLTHEFIYKDANGKEVKRTQITDQTVEVEKQVPVYVLRFERKESANPFDKMLIYLGTLNSKPIWNLAERKWMCTRLDGTSPDGGATYDVVYEFQALPEGDWDIDVFAVDNETGTVAVDAIEGKGRQRMPLYGAQDFSNLGLSYEAATPPSTSIGLQNQ